MRVIYNDGERLETLFSVEKVKAVSNTGDTLLYTADSCDLAYLNLAGLQSLILKFKSDE